MTTTAAQRIPAGSRPTRSRLSAPARELAAFVVFTTWILSGLLLDGWSHNRAKPDTFFTPWHGLLYSGFLVSTAWTTMDRARSRRKAITDTLVDRWTSIGIGAFTVGMLGDFVWHSLLGIEQGIEALLSPTHLLLMSGGLLLATTPLRAAAAGRLDTVGRLGRTLGATWSAAAGAVLAGFFTMELSAFRGTTVEYATAVSGIGGRADERIALGVASVLLATVIVAGAAVTILRLVDPMPGALAVLVTGFAVAMSALDGFRVPALMAAAFAAGAGADVVRSRFGDQAAVVAIPTVLWPAWFLALRLDDAMRWSAPLWTGTVVLATLTAWALTLLPAAGSRAPAT